MENHTDNLLEGRPSVLHVTNQIDLPGINHMAQNFEFTNESNQLHHPIAMPTDTPKNSNGKKSSGKNSDNDADLGIFYLYAPIITENCLMR